MLVPIKYEIKKKMECGVVDEGSGNNNYINA